LQVGGEWTDFVVSGIIEKPPKNSSIQYGIIIPFDNSLSFTSEGGRQCWTCVSVETYVLLNDQNEIDAFTSQVAPFIDGKVEKIYKPGEYIIGFQPLEDIHLNNDYPTGIVSVSDGRYPYILSILALLILILASINFTTMSIGRSISRAKEVGIRKVTGATRLQLMSQFWSEAIITVFISIVFGLIIAKFLMPTFNQLADKQLILGPTVFLLTSVVGLSLLIGLMAGIYPALVLSGFKPINALQGMITKLGRDKHIVLKSLVGFQFGLSVILIISTLIMQNQMQYLQNKNLGFEKEYVVTIPYQVSGLGLIKLWEEGQQIFDRFESKLKGYSGIKNISLSSHTLGTLGWSTLGYTDQESKKFRKFTAQKIDEQYLEMMQIKLLHGRNFSENMSMDKKSVIINQAMAEEFAFDPVVGSPMPGPFKDFQIIGVTNDFNYSSLHNPVTPLAMVMDAPNFINTAPDHTFLDPPIPKISVKLGANELAKSLHDLKTIWAEVAPEQSFNYSFIDDNIGRQYRKESKLSQILSFATMIAIIIACLGLFGISALTIAFRTKEIGIRKVLGASSQGIVQLISFDFLKLVGFAILIASPIAWWAMNQWLQDFAFNVGIQWWIFLLSYAISILLALTTISTQSIRAAISNPVDALRDE